MKLIVMIPAFNEEATIAQAVAEVPRVLPGIDEVHVLVIDDGSTDRTVATARRAGADHVVSHKRNFGLTAAFATGLQAALEQGADIIANTDADCQYVGSEIARLIAPILSGEADFVSGDRQIRSLRHMPLSKKYGNLLGSSLLRLVAGSPLADASSGFRAFTRECAIRLAPGIGHTYTHQTIIQAVNSGMVIREVPVTFRATARHGNASRLIGGVGGHVVKSLVTIVRAMTTYRPLSVLGGLGVLLLFAGGSIALIPVVAYITGDTEGHLQSLILSSVLLIMGVQLVVLGLLADAVSANRRLTEETLYRLRKQGAEQSPSRSARRAVMSGRPDSDAPHRIAPIDGTESDVAEPVEAGSLGR